MNGGLNIEVVCFITPRDLREIADAMEEKWAVIRPGQSTHTKSWYVCERLTIQFSIDQERMNKQQKEK